MVYNWVRPQAGGSSDTMSWHTKPHEQTPQDQANAQWCRVRWRFLLANPLCCDPRCRRLATEVAHIQSVRHRADLRLEPSNLRGYCKAHFESRNRR